MATDKLVDFDHVTDYISREAAIKAVDFEITYLTTFNLATGEMTHPFEERNKGLMDGIEALKKVPAADVVEVVRCMGCRYDHACLTQQFLEENSKIPFNREKFFCSDGERRDAE